MDDHFFSSSSCDLSDTSDPLDSFLVFCISKVAESNALPFLQTLGPFFFITTSARCNCSITYSSNSIYLQCTPTRSSINRGEKQRSQKYSTAITHQRSLRRRRYSRNQSMRWSRLDPNPFLPCSQDPLCRYRPAGCSSLGWRLSCRRESCWLGCWWRWVCLLLPARNCAYTLYSCISSRLPSLKSSQYSGLKKERQVCLTCQRDHRISGLGWSAPCRTYKMMGGYLSASCLWTSLRRGSLTGTEWACRVSTQSRSRPNLYALLFYRFSLEDISLSFTSHCSQGEVKSSHPVSVSPSPSSSLSGSPSRPSCNLLQYLKCWLLSCRWLHSHLSFPSGVISNWEGATYQTNP